MTSEDQGFRFLDANVFLAAVQCLCSLHTGVDKPPLGSSDAAQGPSATAQGHPSSATAQGHPSSVQGHPSSDTVQGHPSSVQGDPSAHPGPLTVHQHSAIDEIPPMPHSWTDVISCAVKDFQKATEILMKSQSLVDKLLALQRDNRVIQSLMVKSPGLVASDPATNDTLRGGLEALTARYRRDCHELYLRHEQTIISQNEARVSQLASDFEEKLQQLAEPFQHIPFTSSTGPIAGSIVATHWTSLALSSYNRQVNEFQIELVERRRAARVAAQAARDAAREEAAKHANDIPREDAISVLVQREVAQTFQQKLDATLKPIQEQLAFLIELQSPGTSPPQQQRQQQQRRQPLQRQQHDQQQQQPLRSQQRPLRRQPQRLRSQPQRLRRQPQRQQQQEQLPQFQSRPKNGQFLSVVFNATEM